MTVLATRDKIRLRASVNEWISERLPVHRRYLRHSEPEYVESKNLWKIYLNAVGYSVNLGSVLISLDATIVQAASPTKIAEKLDRLLTSDTEKYRYLSRIEGDYYRFQLGDGISGANDFLDGEIDLLLTDPPYGISKPYTCEKQIPRRLRNDGRDFIMPKGNFGDWDSVEPKKWLDSVLPKVGGWAVSFCAQAQIGEYQSIFYDHKFVAVGAMVWQKTNPVPFNHRFKPINAWEAMVVGKRPGAKFNGNVIHNVFRYKSPSPQKRIHSTQKPFDLMAHFVDLFTDPGDLVYDPFAGGATTLIAASMKQRRCISWESENATYQLACARIREHLR